MTKKEKVLHIRLGDDLLELAQLKANQMTRGNLSEYVRFLIACENNSTNPMLQQELLKLRQEINRIGVNINQIAKHVNSNVNLPDEKEMLYEHLNKINKSFYNLLDRINKD